jgi:hypothetical protein
LGSSPDHSSFPSPVSKLYRRHTGRLRKRDNLLAGGGGWGGAKSDNGEKVWYSLNHSILSAYKFTYTLKGLCTGEKWLCSPPYYAELDEERIEIG